MMEYVWVALAGLLAGAMNAAAGGGTFVTVPALIAAGVPSVSANMTSTIAMCPGAFASAWAFRKDFRDFSEASLRLLIGVSLAGGACGALLLIYTSSRFLDGLIPWLLLMGSIAFAFGKQIGDWLRMRITLGKASLLATQFLLGVYGGYFGAAIGLMMLAVWTIFGARDLVAMSASRILLVGLTNAVAVVFFVAIGTIFWTHGLVMMGAGIVGGYLGALIARRIPIQKLRVGISCLNFTITAIFFWKMF